MIIDTIAEIAQGYEGSPEMAELLVRGSINAGADIIKFQLVYADELCVKEYEFYNFFKSLEMDFEIWRKLVNQVHEAGKKIYFDVYGIKSLNLAKKLNADGIKISTADFHNEKLILKALANFAEVLISIGGIPIEDIDKLLSKSYCNNKITLMYGFQAEPTDISDNNLRRIFSLRERYKNIKIGFMDHTIGNSENAFYIPLIAIGMGVTCIEKHITLDYELKIEDHISGLSIDRFKKFIDLVKIAKEAMGSAELALSLKEKNYANKSSKILISSVNLNKGHIITDKDIVMKRYSMNISELWYRDKSDIIGKKLSVNLNKNKPFLRGNIL